MTVDVEDWFQVENFKQCIPFSSWSSRELRVEKNTYRLLDLFDSCEKRGAIENVPPAKIHATFFVLGWIAERLPHLVREIHARGHEVASHGYLHNLCYQQSFDDLTKDLSDNKKLLEDIIGAEIYGYRAPSFSITDDILKIIEDCGYLYDSSFNSFGMTGRYGRIDFLQGIHQRIVKISGKFYEMPISNVKLGKFILPWGGGGYFRLIPFRLFKRGVQFELKKTGMYLFYIHPWEIDSEQPRVNEAPAFYRFRHYVNLRNSYIKLLMFFETFSRCSFATCHQYLEKIGTTEYFPESPRR